jgi:hypothetical protein
MLENLRWMLKSRRDSDLYEFLDLFFRADLETMGGTFWPALIVELLPNDLDLFDFLAGDPLVAFM